MMAQNKLKRWFITPWIALIFGGLIHTLTIIATNGAQPAWLGALLAATAVCGTFLWFVLRGVARTSDNLPTMTWGAAVGTIVAAVGTMAGGDPLALFYAGVVYLLGSLIYVYWYSRFGRQASPNLVVGRPLPDFELEELDGTRIRSSELTGQPTVMLFFRGNWCPLCMAQIKEIAAQYQALEQRGVQVALISPQSQSHTRSLARKFDVPFRYLRDPDLNAAKALGIMHEDALPVGMEAMGYDRDAVLPTVIVTNSAGQVLFADETDNYRVRPEPQTFLQILDGELPANSPVGESRTAAS